MAFPARPRNATCDSETVSESEFEPMIMGRCGCPIGIPGMFMPEQERQVQRAFCDRRPEPLKMDFALILWTDEVPVMNTDVRR